MPMKRNKTTIEVDVTDKVMNVAGSFTSPARYECGRLEMTDLEFLIVLQHGDMRWNQDALQQGKALAEKGMCTYTYNSRAGWWEVTDAGKMWIAHVRKQFNVAATTAPAPTRKCPLCGMVWSTHITTCPCVLPGGLHYRAKVQDKRTCDGADPSGGI